MSRELIVRQIKEKEINEFFDFFSKSLRTLFSEYTEKTKIFFYTDPRALDKKDLLRKIKNKDVIVAAFVGNKIVGVIISDRPFGGISFCHWLMVDPVFQRRGIGTSLLSYWEEISKKEGAHGLKIEADERNLRFYKNAGFEVIGLDHKGYFGTDNYILKKIIQEPKEENFLK